MKSILQGWTACAIEWTCCFRRSCRSSSSTSNATVSTQGPHMASISKSIQSAGALLVATSSVPSPSLKPSCQSLHKNPLFTRKPRPSTFKPPPSAPAIAGTLNPNTARLDPPMSKRTTLSAELHAWCRSRPRAKPEVQKYAFNRALVSCCKTQAFGLPRHLLQDPRARNRLATDGSRHLSKSKNPDSRMRKVGCVQAPSYNNRPGVVLSCTQVYIFSCVLVHIDTSKYTINCIQTHQPKTVFALACM